MRNDFDNLHLIKPDMNRYHYLSILLALATLGVAGCATSGQKGSAGAQASGSRLWAQNCARCHNNRSPSELSPAQWDVVALHMRVRAGLTAADHRAILEFLQTNN